MCYLKLGKRKEALAEFRLAYGENFDNSEAFFYAAICALDGKKAFLCMRSEIDDAQENINSALLIEPKGIYHYFLAYIKYDYFHRKFFNTKPTYTEALASAKQAGLSAFDVEQLYKLLGVEMPAAL